MLKKGEGLGERGLKQEKRKVRDCNMGGTREAGCGFGIVFITSATGALLTF